MLSANSNGIGLNVRLARYSLFVKRNKGIYHIPIHSIWRLSITLYIFVFGVDVSAINVGLAPQPLHHDIIRCQAVAHVFRWLPKSGPASVVVTACWQIHVRVFPCLWVRCSGLRLSSSRGNLYHHSQLPHLMLLPHSGHCYNEVADMGIGTWVHMGGICLDAGGPSPIMAILQRVLGTSSCFNDRVFCLEK
jgi:hypothetical protein